MKKLLIGVLLLLGCTARSDFRGVANRSLDKTIFITVETEVNKVAFVIDGDSVTINVSTAIVKLYGTGALISSTGHILTCAHLFRIGKIKSIKVTLLDERKFVAELLNKDVHRDLGLLKIDAYTPYYFALDKPGTLQIGEDVILIGNPLGQSWSVSKGIVSQLNRDIDGIYNLVQTDAPINPGNSGGPLINRAGKLVGIASMIIPPVNAPINTGIGMAVSLDEINIFLHKFKGIGK